MKVICFGDSNTYGYDPRSWIGGRYERENRWVDILAGKTGWDVVNRGENGREIPSAAVPFPKDADRVIIMLGTNDLLQLQEPETVSEKMEQFLSALETDRNKILLIAPPPVTAGEWVRDRKMIKDSVSRAERYQKLARRLGIEFADGGRWGVAMSYDGVHFTEAGHKALAEGLYAHLTEKNGSR